MILESMTDKEISKTVGRFCKKFRTDYLRISMTDFAKDTGLKIQNVNAFEGGRANNIKYLYYYYHFSNSNHLKEVFKNNLFNIIK